MTVLEMVKFRCGIPENVLIYDSRELDPLIRDAIEDMKTAGVPAVLLPEGPKSVAEEISQRVITAITLYVQGIRGQDRSDTQKYIELYKHKLHKLMLEEEEDYVDDSDSTSE